MKQISLLTNKKGFELSINFIVMVILTIIVFSATLIIAYKVLNKTTALKDAMDKQTEDQLESMVTSGNEEVVIAFKNKETRPGDAVTFGLGVYNTLPTEENFSVNLGPSTALDRGGNPYTFGSWGYLKSDDIGPIKKNAYKLKSVVLIPPKNATPGITYIFNLNVTYYNSTGNKIPYPLRDSIKKINVQII